VLKGSRKARLIKKVGATGVLTVAALAFPAAASAHHATVGVSCTNATFEYASFHGATSTVHYEVWADSTRIVQGDHTFGKPGSTLNVPLTIYGDHTLVAKTWWEVEGGGRESATQRVSCGEAPAAASAPAATAAPAPAPASGVQGVQVSSPAAAPARAVLGTRTSCRSNVVRARVTGRNMRRVTFSVNGKRVRTVAVRGRRVVRATLPRRGSGPQAITVRVRYANRTQVLTTRAARCSQAQVAPQFTG
jgi:hypothetical protein